MSETEVVSIAVKVNPAELKELMLLYNLQDESQAIRRAIEQAVNAEEIIVAVKRARERRNRKNNHANQPTQ